MGFFSSVVLSSSLFYFVSFYGFGYQGQKRIPNLHQIKEYLLEQTKITCEHTSMKWPGVSKVLQRQIDSQLPNLFLPSLYHSPMAAEASSGAPQLH